MGLLGYRAGLYTYRRQGRWPRPAAMHLPTAGASVGSRGRDSDAGGGMAVKKQA